MSVNRMGNDNDTPAIVLGGGLNGLGVARSLHAAGVSTWLADVDVTRPEMRTRCARPLRLATLRGEGLVHELIACATSTFVGRRPVLLLTQEHTVRALAHVQGALSVSFRFVLPRAEVLYGLMHKPTFDAWARESGLRVPLSQPVRSSVDVDAALTLLSMPVVIKPGLHVPQFEAQFRKAYVVGHREEARTLLNVMLSVLPDLIVQEWVPGSDADVYFCLQQISAAGSVEASFVGRKIRSWPPVTGGTASCLPAPDAAMLTERTANFFLRSGVRGLASMEYKRHADTGEFIAIEPTVGRTDYQEEVATLNGVNLPYAYYLDAIGKSAAPRAAQPSSGRKIIWRDRNADECALAHTERTAGDWPASTVVRDALWRWTDPQPWLASRYRRTMGRLRGKARDEKTVHGVKKT